MVRLAAMALWVGMVLSPTMALSESVIDVFGDPVQGSLLWGQAPVGAAHITINQRRVPVSPEGTFVFGVGRDETAPIKLTAVNASGTIAEYVIEPIPREFDIQRIDGLPPKKVTPNPAVFERIGREAALIKNVRAGAADTSRFPVTFAWPVTGRISGIFGSQRILNGKPRSPHRGVDVAAPEGTPIVAPAPGVVRLTHDDMYYTGKTVMLDHGFGVTSVYVHLSDITVAVDQVVEAGDVLGAVGQTGRATGPHLHWGISWFGVHVDPQPLAGPMPAQ